MKLACKKQTVIIIITTVIHKYSEFLVSKLCLKFVSCTWPKLIQSDMDMTLHDRLFRARHAIFVEGRLRDKSRRSLALVMAVTVHLDGCS